MPEKIASVRRRALRRLAMQLAVQMPADRDDSLVVLAALRELIEFENSEPTALSGNLGNPSALKVVR